MEKAGSVLVAVVQPCHRGEVVNAGWREAEVPSLDMAADELIDSHLIVLNERVSQVMRVLLLPSYVGITLLAIFMIIP